MGRRSGSPVAQRDRYCQDDLLHIAATGTTITAAGTTGTAAAAVFTAAAAGTSW